MQEATARLRAVILERGYERREQPFRLSSGGLSRDYVDLRRALSRGEDLEIAGRAVIAALDGVEYDAIGGMTMGADPVAHCVALLAGRSWFSVRKAERQHGTGRRVEGSPLGVGTRAVVFEDTVSTGRSLLEALEVVEGTGAAIVCACTILDRGESLGAELAARRPHLPLVRVLSYKDIGIDPL